MSTVRSFVAVPLPVGIQDAIFEAAQRLSGRLPGIKWARKASNLHVTLGFLGQVEEEQLRGFASEMERTLMGQPGFRLVMRGFGAFPIVRHANVIWAGAEDPSGGLARVAGQIQELAERFGLAGAAEGGGGARRPRPFQGHVTVGRADRRLSRQGVDARGALASLADHGFGEVWVNEVHLYESILGGDGSTYVLRGMATLEGATHGDVREG
jgi:2'-5' RNA ligase